MMIHKSPTCVLNMPMNEGQGHPHDSSGYGNNGTNNGADWVYGDYGWALDFVKANSDYVDCGNGTSLQIRDEITVSMWVKPDVVDVWQWVISKGNWNSEWVFGITDAGKIDLTIRDVDGGHNAIYGNTALSHGVWQLIAATYSKSAGKVRLYLDGASDRAAYSLSKNIADSGNPVMIGRSSIGTFFDGIIDDPHIYNIGWTATEIMSYFNATKARYGL